MSKIDVSLDPYRTKGVRVFGGEERGKVVAKEIIRQYGENVNIIIPDDVICISTHFEAGFNSVLPNAINRNFHD